MADMNGKFVWYELMTSDTAAAADFYKTIIGWDAADSGLEEMDYTIFSINGRGVGGLMTVPEEAKAAGAKPSWIGYVAVEDVDVCAAAFEREGGRVHVQPTDIPNVGRFAIAADPQGAVLALFKSVPMDTQYPEPAPGTLGHGGWHELYASDWERAFAFYAERFGWEKVEAIDMGAMGIYQLFGKGGTAFGGMFNKPEAVPSPYWNYYFNVASVEAAAAMVKDNGGQLLNGPMEVPGGSWIIQCLDPQGAMFSLVSAGK